MRVSLPRRGGLHSARRWFGLGLDSLLPRLCPGCGVELAPGRWICPRCRRAFRPVPSGNLCLRCRVERRPEGDREAGSRCQRSDHGNVVGGAAFWMEPPLDSVVHALKYAGRKDLARPLGRLLAARVRPSRSLLVTAIPLHRTRRRERGYNQAALLAREAGSRWGAPFVDGILERSRATRPQARLPESMRARNMDRAFRVPVPQWVAGRGWVVVDDVMTTGSTMMAAAQALLRAGATDVLSVALALA